MFFARYVRRAAAECPLPRTSRRRQFESHRCLRNAFFWVVWHAYLVGVAWSHCGMSSPRDDPDSKLKAPSSLPNQQRKQQRQQLQHAQQALDVPQPPQMGSKLRTKARREELINKVVRRHMAAVAATRREKCDVYAQKTSTFVPSASPSQAWCGMMRQV